MKEKNMKILKYAILIGLIAYGQSIFAMEQIENAEAIQKMSLRELAKYRAKMNELAESMPNARQKAKIRDAYTEQINLASTETVSASSAQAMANLPQLPTEQEKQDFYAEIKRVRDAEYGDQYAVSWIPRAQYTYNAIQSL